MSATNPDALIGKFTHRTFDCALCGDGASHLNRRPIDGSAPYEAGSYVVANDSGDVRWTPAHPPAPNLVAEQVKAIEAESGVREKPVGNGGAVDELRRQFRENDEIAEDAARAEAIADRASDALNDARAHLQRIRDAAVRAGSRAGHPTRDGVIDRSVVEVPTEAFNRLMLVVEGKP